MGQVPLERALSKLGVASRSRTRALIAAGLIGVNGRTIRDPLFPVVPEKDRITVDGDIVKAAAGCTIMLNKPRGTVTTRSDEKGRKTVYDLLPAHLQHLHPVGRLDMASTGLLLLTTDTRLSHFLTEPGHEVPRIYAATVEGRIADDHIKILTKGIQDKGELLKASSVTLRKASGKESHVMVELNEGKNREIRRLFKALGHEVIALKRIAFGTLKLGQLGPGQFREVHPHEIAEY